VQLGRNKFDSPPRIGTCIGSPTQSGRMPRSATSHRHRRCSCPPSPGRLRLPDRLRRPGYPSCKGRPCTNIQPGPPNGGRSELDGEAADCLKRSSGTARKQPSPPPVAFPSAVTVKLPVRQLRSCPIGASTLNLGGVRFPDLRSPVVVEKRQKRIATSARHLRGSMKQRAGEHYGSARRRLEAAWPLLREADLATLELRIEVDRDCEAAMSRSRRRVVAMRPEVAAVLCRVTRDDVPLHARHFEMVHFEDLGQDPPQKAPGLA
jgi:hypothetical protein